LVLLVANCPGCGSSRREPGNPRALRTEVVDGDTGKEPTLEIPYSFEWIEPKKKEYRPGEPVPVKVKLLLNGGKPPSFVQLLVRKGEVNVNSMSLEPEEAYGADAYTFTAEVRAPQDPGKYTILIEAIRSILRYDEGQRPQTQRKSVYSAPVSLTVQRPG
jgi:hypothetical protein